MPFAALLVGAILIIVAINKTYPALATELEQDVPAYAKWAAAIAAILALGYVPGLRTPSRYLLALVLVVLVVKNYNAILQGLGLSGSTSAFAPTTPNVSTAPGSTAAPNTTTGNLNGAQPAGGATTTPNIFSPLASLYGAASTMPAGGVSDVGATSAGLTPLGLSNTSLQNFFGLGGG